MTPMRSAVCLLIPLLSLGSLVLSCSQKGEAPTATASPAAPVSEPAKPAERIAAPAGPKGSVFGVVLLTGTAPKPEALQRSSDPVCAKTEAVDETILSKGGKLQNVVVRVVEAVPGALPPDPVVVDQQGCMYRPRVQAAMRGQRLQIRNSDGTLHNIHSYEGMKTGFNLAQPPGAQGVERPLGAQVPVVKLKCDVHPWMTGYIVLSDHPYFATTAEDGSFKIEGLPPGKYTLEAWHEKLGTQKTAVTVAPDAVTKTELKFATDPP